MNSTAQLALDPKLQPESELPNRERTAVHSAQTRAHNRFPVHSDTGVQCGARGGRRRQPDAPTGYRVDGFPGGPCALRPGVRRPPERNPRGNLHLLAPEEDRSRAGV